MSTVLYPDIVFGPIHSRRLGISLGINLLPLKKKYCTFDCVYCECGLGDMEGHIGLPSVDEVRAALEARLQKMKEEGPTPDVLTFAGNGEPTLHPKFPEIIEVVSGLRDRYFPEARISVLSNATRINRPEIRNALLKVDNNILKLDSAIESTMRKMNQPWNPDFHIGTLVENLKLFQGKLIIQTMFLRGSHAGEPIDNTTDREVDAWIELVKEINPYKVMIYSIDRETPIQTLEKVSGEELRAIASRLQQSYSGDINVAG